jgi:hypothetical protein
MHFDVFYASKSQDKYGKAQKQWEFNKTVKGFAETVGAEDKSKTFFEYKGKLLGRLKEDVRIGEENTMYPVTDILITNIRDIKTNVEYYIETAGERSGLSTIYEIEAIEPHIDPFNKIEYWRLFLTKSDTQVMRKYD